LGGSAMTNEEMIELLNGDMQHEIKAALTYLHQHAIFLADKIVGLGGTPDVTAPAIEPQPDVESMLKHDLELEKEAVANYKRRAEQADELGDVGLKVRLEELAAEEADHQEAIARFLRGLGS
ncbi:MAG TPA: ferritin-like domain-containing protein, partial [Actinomycetota bacterium]|nr:ferritin-like domain-containing protein [Actinomycetota bacterium]